MLDRVPAIWSDRKGITTLVSKCDAHQTERCYWVDNQAVMTGTDGMEKKLSLQQNNNKIII